MVERLIHKAAWRLALSIAAACAAAATLPALAEQGIAQTYEAKDCEQEDSNVTALRACTAVLDAGNLDVATQAKYRVRRGYAWLADDDGADGALEDFNAALKLSPGDVKALKGRAKANTLLGAHDKAVNDWSAILASNLAAKEAEAAYMARGASHLAAGKHDAALADYAKAIELNPKSETAHIARAGVYAALKDRNNALKEYDLARAINGGSYEFYLSRAQMAESWGETQSAIDNYAAALKIDPRRAWDARKSLKRLGIDYPSE